MNVDHKEKNIFGSFQMMVLEWYDRALLLAAINDKQQHYIAMFFDEKVTYEQFLYIPVTKNMLNAFLRGEISLRQIMQRKEGTAYLVDYYYTNRKLDLNKGEIKKIKLGDLEADVLPRKDYFKNYLKRKKNG